MLNVVDYFVEITGGEREFWPNDFTYVETNRWNIYGVIGRMAARRKFEEKYKNLAAPGVRELASMSPNHPCRRAAAQRKSQPKA